MLVIAIIADLLSVFPFVNFFSTIGGAFALYAAGSHAGVQIFSKKNQGLTLVTILIEVFLGFVPAWTVRVLLAQRAARQG